MNENLKDRQLLHDRHRLSHEQIDRLLGENRAREFLQEKMMRMASIKHFLEITDILREAGISFICIKGPLLSYRIYGDATVRFSHDADLLVEPDSLDRIIALMLETQYELTEGVVWSDVKFKQEIILHNIHHLSFFNKKLKFCVEIHWVLTNNFPIHQKVAEMLLKQNLTTLEFTGRNFTVFNKEFELTYLIMHGAKHGWCRLKWLVDIKDYPVNDLDLEKWQTLIKNFHAERILGQTNHFLKQIFDTKLPLVGSSRLPNYIIRYVENAIIAPINNSFPLQFIILNYRYKRLLYSQLFYRWGIFKTLFSRPGDVALYDFSSKGAYYLYRPFSFIKRRILNV
jgi:hypothetical protein